MSIRITELDAITSLQSGDYIAVDNESTGTHKFDALNIGANIGQNIANTYSSSASYAIGQYCLYDNNLYKCTTTISTPEAWNSSHWIQVTVGEGLYEKVDKVSGKGLSTNDFTNEYKQKLGGIEAGAEVNVQADWTENDSSKDDYIKNKPGNATTSASGFMSASDKQKLDNIEAGAEVNVQPNWAEDDSSKDDYIKNKPTIDTALSTSSDNAVRNSAITAGINQVQGNLDTEITNRQNAVSGEQLARENADSALDGRLDTVEETLPNKANINGSYEEMTVGSAEQLVSTEFIEDTELYTFRASGGGMDIGDRETDKLVGGTVAWNQLISFLTNTTVGNGITYTASADGTITATGTATANAVFQVKDVPLFGGHVYMLSGCPSGGGAGLYALYANQTNPQLFDIGSGSIKKQNADTTGAFYIIVYNGQTVNLKFTPQLFDLTQMFGSTIADALYAMEQAESGSGVAWFKKYFPKSYYAYDSGSLQSVNVASHDMTGFNQWDEEWDIGDIDGITGEFKTGNYLKTKNLVRVLSNTSYYINIPSTIYLYEYDANENAIVNNGAYAYHTISTSGVYTTDSRTSYISFRNNVNDALQTYGHNICINRVWTGNRNGEYEPYELHSYAYDESVELRGMPSLVDGELVYDGDTYEADGTVNRKWGIVDLGTLTWERKQHAGTGNYYFQSATISDAKGDAPSLSVCSKYRMLTNTSYLADLNNHDGFTVYKSVYIRDDAYTDATTFKTAMSGVYLVYELATQTSEQATGFTNPQVVESFGTEEYVDAGVKNETRDVSIPVGHVTQYMANLRDKLQHLPNLAKEDGDYFVNQTGTQMKLKKVEGYYEDLVVGVADNLNTNIRANDQTPYLFRTSGGSVDIGDREYINGIVGGTVAWNQLATLPSNPFTSRGITVSMDTNGVVSLSGTAEGGYSSVFKSTDVVSGHKYAILTTLKANPNNKTVRFGFLNVHGRPLLGGAAITVSNASLNSSVGIEGFAAGDDLSGISFTATITDLTLALGSTIADYVYSLEQATAGAGVAFFKSLFPKPYYAYNSGELMSVRGLVSHDMVGFNAWDEEWEVGGLVWATGAPYATSDRIRSKNFCRILPNTAYRFTQNGASDGGIFFYDEEKNFISYSTFGITATTPSNAYWFKIGNINGTTYKNDICINLSWDGSEDGNYEPYQKWSYPLDSDLELRGIPKLDASNNLYYDGDVYESDGTVGRDWGYIVFDGSEDENWSLYAAQNGFFIQLPTMKSGARQSGIANFLVTEYRGASMKHSIWFGANSDYIYVREVDDLLSSLTVENWRTYLASRSLQIVYPLATPTTETADPYTSPQIVNDFGTEEFVIDDTVDVPMPVGHNTDYPINLKSKLEMAPDSPDGDGDYIVRQTNGTNEYVPLIIEDQLPAVPSTDGTYTLTVTVASGEATYSWT